MSESLPLTNVSGQPASDTAITVLVCHGRGQDESALAGLTDRFPDRVASVRLRAPHADDDGFRWYDTVLPYGSHDLSQPRAGEFRESLDRLHECYNALGDRVGLLGYSQGAMLCLAALIERPSAYRWAGALHGYLPESHSAPALVGRTDDVPVLVSYGRDDEAIPPWRSRRAAATLTAGGADVTESGYDCGHEPPDAEFTEVSSWVDDVTSSPTR